MRRPANKTTSVVVDSPEKPTIGGTYEPLNVNGENTSLPTYQPLTRQKSGTGHTGGMYEDLNSKPLPKEPANGYAELGPRDEPKAPYMTVTHTT